MSIHFLSRTGRQRHCGLQLWSCFGNSSPRSSMLFLLGLHRFCHVLLNSAHDSNPRGCVVLRQRFDQNFNTVSIFMTTNLYVQDCTDSRILENPSFRSSLPVASRHCVLSAKCCIPFPPVSSVKKHCPISTIFEPASEQSLDNFWSSDNCSNLHS